MAFDGQMSESQMQQMQAMLSMAQGGMGAPMPGMGGEQMPDPGMAQAYMAMFQYLTAQQNMGAGPMGMPPMPFSGMPPAAPFSPSMPAEPTVAVSVEGMKFQYQLTEDDLQKVFSRYGGVKNIRVDDAGAAAQITFHAFSDAQSAMNDLNGKVLNGLDGTLRISWVNQGQNPSLPAPAPYGMPFPGMGFPPAPFPGAAGMGFPGGAPAPQNHMGSPGGYGGRMDNSNAKGVRKYTCRFIIGIDNDKEFQVARRVIGAKGANMKRIVQRSDAKLRLRGTGSGYFEGAGQKESSEPLQLCISCTNGENYKAAVAQVEDLLKRVYDEYKAFCSENGKPIPDLQINFSENQLVYSASRSATGADSFQDNLPGSPETPKKTRQSRRVRTGGKGGNDKEGGGDDRGEPGPNAPQVDEIEKMIDMRNEARRACNFAEADRVREALHSQGVALMDEPGGRGRGTEVTTWRYWRD